MSSSVASEAGGRQCLGGTAAATVRMCAGRSGSPLASPQSVAWAMQRLHL
jgi:hypothetical protein